MISASDLDDPRLGGLGLWSVFGLQDKGCSAGMKRDGLGGAQLPNHSWAERERASEGQKQHLPANKLAPDTVPKELGKGRVQAHCIAPINPSAAAFHSNRGLQMLFIYL